MKDIRLVTTALAVVLSIVGYIVLVITDNAKEAHDLVNQIGLPALTFILGLGSNLIGRKND